MHVLTAVRPGSRMKIHVARTDSEVQALGRTYSSWRVETVQDYEQEMWNAALDPTMA